MGFAGVVSSASTLTVGQMGNYGYGSVTMEKNFRVSVKIMTTEELEVCEFGILWRKMIQCLTFDFVCYIYINRNKPTKFTLHPCGV